MLLMEISSSTSVSLFWIVLATLVAPAIGHATRRVLPEVVLLLGLGVLIGPSGLQLAGATNLEMLKQLGLGLLFLSAGYEIDPNDLVGRRTRSAALTWLVCLVIGFGVGMLIVPGHRWLNAAALAIALGSTALGTLMPILREQGVLDWGGPSWPRARSASSARWRRWRSCCRATRRGSGRSSSSASACSRRVWRSAPATA